MPAIVQPEPKSCVELGIASAQDFTARQDLALPMILSLVRMRRACRQGFGKCGRAQDVDVVQSAVIRDSAANRGPTVDDHFTIAAKCVKVIEHRSMRQACNEQTIISRNNLVIKHQ